MILTQEQQKQTLRLIADKMPDQLKLPYALWSRKAIALLIKERFGVVLPERTMTDYLSRWGFSAQKPMRRAAEQRPELVRKWREEVYPAIKRRAELEGADIHWGDETGLRNDDVRGRSFAKRGKTPVVRVLNKRFGRSIISTITNRGQMRWMVFKGALDAEIFQDFLARLIKGQSARCSSSWTTCRCIMPKSCAHGWKSTRSASNCSSCRATHPNSTPWRWPMPT
ncbi:MAG: IS630 family transposase [Flavobacteriales bacterium]|nr:IS630 family transposase [Flavobacteriales bacterium]